MNASGRSLSDRLQGSTGTAILAMAIGFWLIMRAVNKDQTGRTLIDHVLGHPASQSPYLTQSISTSTQPGTSLSLSAPGSGSVLASLFPKGTNVALKRHDQGRDLQAAPNSPVLAPGNGYLVRNGSDPSGFGNSYPIVHFTTGPWAGLDIYFGHVKSLLSSNQNFTTGQAIAQTQAGKGPYVGNATGLPGWTEVGRAPAGNPGAMGQPTPPGL